MHEQWHVRKCRGASQVQGPIRAGGWSLTKEAKYNDNDGPNDISTFCSVS
jgi:hypothetical protein